jgi:hypothetical protein
MLGLTKSLKLQSAACSIDLIPVMAKMIRSLMLLAIILPFLGSLPLALKQTETGILSTLDRMTCRVRRIFSFYNHFQSFFLKFLVFQP